MSKRQFKSQASSGRAGGGFGAFGSAGFGSSQASTLSCIQEPPDYSLISDSNLVVAFKNLSKKDSTTKAKALEDLQAALISNNSDVEDAVVEIWVKLFPRLSIDSARRVRQLAHNFNGQLCAKCGKRIAKHLPRMSGPWLAGTFDVDRAAARAAQDALATVFPTPEKSIGLRKTFQESILEYCKEALLNETVQTLSDERTVSKDDAEATYARVVSTSIAVVTSLLETLPTEEVSKHNHVYELVLGDGRIWDLASHSDAGVRRAIHRLVQTCLARTPDLIENNLKAVSKAYIYKGLTSDQTSSALDFVQTLDALTTKYPSLWTDYYSGKKSAISRLQQGLKHGSHSSTAAYWYSMANVLRNLPAETLPTTYDEVADLLVAARDGVARKEERFNASSAWPTYFTLVHVVTTPLPDSVCEDLLEAFAMPPINQYLHPAEESAKWSIIGAKAASLVSRAALVKRLPPLLERKWPHLAEKLIEAARMSQPEQSKDFDKSQKHVASSGERWAGLQRDFYAGDYTLPESLKSTFLSSNLEILKGCTSLLKSRNGKPYGAAAIIEEQLRACGSIFMSDEEFKQILMAFVQDELPKIMFSPSQRHLARCLYAVKDLPEFQSAFEATLAAILDAPEAGEVKIRTLHALFPSTTPQNAVALARSSEALQGFLCALPAGRDNAETQNLQFDLVKLDVTSQDTSDKLLSGLTATLSLLGPEVHSGLESLEKLAMKSPSTVQAFMETGSGRELLPSVLRLEQSPDDGVAEKASSLSSRLSSAMGEAANDAKYSMLMQNLEQASRSSLTMDALIDLANKIVDGSESSDGKELMPNIEVWQRSISAATKPPTASLSMLSPLGGAVHLVQSDATNANDAVQYDGEGLSQALRIAMYLAKMLLRPEFAAKLGNDLNTILALLDICVQLAEDNTSIVGGNRLWIPTAGEAVDTEVMDFVSDANSALKKYWESLPVGAADNERVPFFAVLDGLRTQHHHASPMAYYVNVVLAKAYENLFEIHGYSSEQAKTSDDAIKSMRAAKDTVALVSFIVGFGHPLSGSKALTRLCNELVADLTELKVENREQAALELLVLLNSILQTQEGVIATVQKTRVIFFTKHILSWLEADAWLPLKAEVCKTLSYLTLHIADMYGEHWAQILRFLTTSWGSSPLFATLSDEPVISESGVLLLHASLKLYGALYKLSKSEEPNDDLVEALQENKTQLHEGLIAVLKSSSGMSDETHQPLMVTNELLARELSRVPFKPIPDVEELFPLLYTPSHAVQGAAFDLLHRQIPAAQEQISFDAALDDKTAQLPDELLSLVIDAPTLDSLADASFERAMPLSLQGFLYSWRVLFDHFSGSSYRVKSDYVEQIKEGGYLKGLLDLIFDFLGHTRGRPVDASKFDIQEFVADMDSSPEKDVQWLLSHLYYLALSHLPSLVKSYFLDIRSRQTSQAIESWTAKYISPLIVSYSLQSVAEWAEKSVKDDPDYENMTVKVGMRSKEINVSYLVDEQTMAIKVILPDTYPLDSAKVVTVHRVAVKEEKWQSWLRNCQGVITFSNGSITDGLSAWRKNVTGALKGQTECAICYSIISGDKQLPTKRCPTCKNLFHSSCLLKWFKTSNASTCPLCRNPFNFN
ncbi:ring zinc finger [Lecanosticta acicola]|uniref:E3 ubiquitin-protein ligase listerin n=1 Tax=Lecanosticta acicola TaxID=111012 RepID=A0AAI9EDW5_9PEZI|nr:ring zinc finger [Lecanosticta acicola]